MDTRHRNARLIHQIDEFLDLDLPNSHFVADFIALIDAVREGLTQIDEDLQIPDSQINLLFLTKLTSRPEWKDWATAMLRDSRVNSSNLTECFTFQDLAKLATKHENAILQEEKLKSRDESKKNVPSLSKKEPSLSRSHTQKEINAFVSQQMNDDQTSRRCRNPSRSVRGHTKRPSQEEINEFVIRQMRREQEKTARVRSYSHPEPRTQGQSRSRPPTMRCTFCGDSYHQTTNCWRRWRVAVEALQGNCIPKQTDFRNGVPGQPRVYVSGYAPF